MNEITPQQYADLWYLKFGTDWIVRGDLDFEWKNIARTLMKNNLADYDIVHRVQVSSSSPIIIEIIKLKERTTIYANN